MNARNPLLWACIVAAGSTATHADIFTWLNGTGLWEDHAMWNGPVGQYPDSILDTATISGENSEATLSQNLTVGTLNIINGASVLSNNNSVFVNGDTIIAGSDSDLTVTESDSLRDFDTDTLTLNSHGYLIMNGGLAQFDEALIINRGHVFGHGIIEMNSTSGDLVIGNGSLWNADESDQVKTLLVTRTDSSTSKLDWTSPDSYIGIWHGNTIHNQLPYAGPLRGNIVLYRSSDTSPTTFISDEAILTAAGSSILMEGGHYTKPVRIEAPILDVAGDIAVEDHAELDAPLIALHGNAELSENATLVLSAEFTRFNAVEITSTGPASTFQFDAPQSTLSIANGTTTVDLGDGARFDLDGIGDLSVDIADDSTLWINAEFLDATAGSPFDGTLNIEGALHIQPFNGQSFLNNNGEIHLDSGDITGRGVYNTGLIRGVGSIEGHTVNDGEIIADGGTLQFGQVDMDGDNGQGVILAQTGDIIMNMQQDGIPHDFTGSILVGDGAGIREVINADVYLLIRDDNGQRGSMEMNSGFVGFNRFSSRGDTVINGVSRIVAMGNSPEGISFNDGSVTTINGTLEADGNIWFTDGAQVNGTGTIDLVSAHNSIVLYDGADLGEVSLISSGQINIAASQNGEAGLHAMTMRDTASLRVSISYSQDQQQLTNDKFNVHKHAILDGTLLLRSFPQSEIPTGHTLTVLEADNISGTFDHIDFSALGPDRRAIVTVTDTTVEVFVTCFADLNADGKADFFDVSAFITLYNMGDSAADLNNDGNLNFFDVSAFLSAFGTGC